MITSTFQQLENKTVYTFKLEYSVLQKLLTLCKTFNSNKSFFLTSFLQYFMLLTNDKQIALGTIVYHMLNDKLFYNCAYTNYKINNIVMNITLVGMVYTLTMEINY